MKRVPEKGEMRGARLPHQALRTLAHAKDGKAALALPNSRRAREVTPDYLLDDCLITDFSSEALFDLLS